MWIVNLETIGWLDRVEYCGQDSFIVPIQNMKFSVKPGETLIIAVRGQGIFGHGRILSQPIKVSNLIEKHKASVKNRSFLQVYMTTHACASSTRILPWSILDRLPIQRRRKRQNFIGKKYFYWIGHYTHSCLKYLISGDLHDPYNCSYRFPEAADFRLELKRRLHYIHDTAKGWLLYERIRQKTRDGVPVACEMCGMSVDLDPEHFFQLHFNGSMARNAKYLKKDFSLLCPNCHALENYKTLKKR